MTNTNSVIVTMTNVVQTVIEQAFPGADTASYVVRQMSTLSNETLFVVFLFVFNSLLKKAPSVYNELIPAISVASATLAYPCLFGFTVRNCFIGFGLGFIPTGGHQIFQQFGFLRERVRTGNTDIVKNPNPPKPPPSI